MIRILRDFETRCDVSVTDVGAWKYVSHPSHQVLCVGWRVRREAWGAPLVAIVASGSDGRRAVERRVEERGYIVSTLDAFFCDYDAADVHAAHNVGFEVATECVRYPHLRPLERRWSCTAARARRLGLPGSLADACRVLRTSHQKSAEGHGAMLQVSQPRPTYKNNPSVSKWFEDAERLGKCAAYCLDDVLAECDLDDYLPELPESERAFWLQTELCNRRGMRLDTALIGAMERVVGEYSQAMLDEVRRVTGDADFTLTNPNAIRDFCAQRGAPLADLRAATVEAVLAAHRSGTRRLDAAAALVLEARQEVGGKSSVAKLAAMRERVMDDSRVRDLTIYHGAHTGRTTGSGINVLNLPRPYKGFDQDVVVASLLRGVSARRIRVELGVSPAVASSAALRGTIVPSPGKKLVVGDYSSVEPCCLFTLAGQWDAVEILRSGGNLYVELGKTVYGRVVDKQKDIVEYTVCKILVLACGYGMGLTKFSGNVDAQGIALDDRTKEAAHAAYRSRFPGVPALWRGLKEAAKAAIRRPGSTFSYSGVDYASDGWWLVCTLPSGRSFYYPNARLQSGKYSEEIVYEGWMRVDGRPAGWGDVRTWGGSLVENVVQAVCRDVMAEDELEVEALDGWQMLLTVYDELVAECPVEEQGAAERMQAIMSQSPAWLPRMPVSAKCFVASRYRKD